MRLIFHVPRPQLDAPDLCVSATIDDAHRPVVGDYVRWKTSDGPVGPFIVEGVQLVVGVSELHSELHVWLRPQGIMVGEDMQHVSCTRPEI